MKKIDLAVISKSSEMMERAQDLCSYGGYSFGACLNVDDFTEKELTFSKCPFVLLDASTADTPQMTAGMVQVIRQIAPACYCLVAVDTKIPKEHIDFIRKSGANLVLLEKEIFLTSKLDFVISQVVASSFLPIKALELVKGSTPTCHLYHLMPLNKKFLPVVRKGELIDENRLKLISQVNELYVRREDIGAWSQYVQSQLSDPNNALTGPGRCRAQFLHLTTVFCDLVMLASDQSEHTSFETGKGLYEKCEKMMSELIASLAELGNAWDIVNHTSMNRFGLIERAPAIACYAGLLGHKSGFSNINEIMIAVLMADLGLLDLEPRLLRKIRSQQIDSLHPEDLQAYQNHPTASLTKILNRKLPVPDVMKSIISCTHERFDQKGFPAQPRAEKIPPEAYIIQFCEELDQASLVSVGQQRPNIETLKNQIFDKEFQAKDRFPVSFLEQIRRSI